MCPHLTRLQLLNPRLSATSLRSFFAAPPMRGLKHLVLSNWMPPNQAARIGLDVWQESFSNLLSLETLEMAGCVDPQTWMPLLGHLPVLSQLSLCVERMQDDSPDMITVR